MSDWEQRALSRQQIVYAALDALVTGQLFRGLRLRHASPTA
jgi:ribonuclease D